MALLSSTYDGSNDYATRGADLTGSADSKLFTIAFAIKPSVISGSKVILASTGRAYWVRLDTSGRVSIYAENSAGTGILNTIASVGSALQTGEWYQISASFDMSDTGKRHLVINGVEDSFTVFTYTNDTIDFTTADHSVGAEVNGANKFNGDISMVYMQAGEYVDLSVQSNREKFYRNGIIDLGADASIITGTQPILYAPDGDPSTNAGTGGNYSITGSLGAGDAPPQGKRQAIWNSTGDTDMNDGFNYTVSGLLLETDDLLFNNTSVVNAIATSGLVANSFTATSDYSGDLDYAGYDLTTVSGQSWDHTGAFDLDSGTFTITGDGDQHIGAGVGAITYTNASVVMEGNNTLDWDKLFRPANMTVAPSGFTTTMNGAYNANGPTNILTRGAGTFTLNQKLTVFVSTQTNPFQGTPGGMTNGTANLNVQVGLGSPLTVNVPMINYTGTGNILFTQTGPQLTVNQTGDWYFSNRIFSFSTQDTIWNTNSYDFTCGDFRIGGSINGMTLNASGSTFSIDDFLGTIYNSAPCSGNFGSSQWTITGNWTAGTQDVYDVGTAQFTFTGASKTVTTEGQPMPTCIFQNDASFNDSSTITNLQLSSGNTYDFDNTATYTISNYNSGDWDGAALESDSGGSQWSLVAPTGVTLNNATITDCDASTGPTVTAYTVFGNTDGGNNSANILFSPPAGGNVWASVGDTDMNTDGNWSLGHVPFSFEPAIYDATSSVNSIASADFTPGDIIANATYSGDLDYAGYDVTTSGSQLWDHTGALDWGSGTLTLLGSGTQHVGAGVGTVTYTDTTVDASKGATVDWDKLVRPKDFHAASTGFTTIFSGANSQGGCTNILYENGGSFLLNQKFTVFVSTQTEPLRSTGPFEMDGSSNLQIQGNNTSPLTVNISGIDSPGDGNLLIFNVSTTETFTINQLGEWHVHDEVLSVYGGNVQWDTNGYHVHCDDLRVGQNAGGGSSVFNWGSSNVIVEGDFLGNTYDADTSTHNFQTSQWTVGGNFTVGTNAVHNVGTFDLTLSGISAQSFTSNGQPFYDVLVDKSGNTFTMADDFSCNILDIDDGGFDTNGNDLTIASGFLWDSDDGITLDGNVHMTGDGTFHIADGSISYGTTSATLDIDGNVTVDLDKDQVIFSSIIMADSGKTVNWTGDGAFTGSIGGALTINSGIVNMSPNSQLISLPLGAGSPIVLNTGSTITGDATAQFGIIFAGGANSTLTIPAIDTPVSLVFANAGGGTAVATYDMSADLYCASLLSYGGAVSSTSDMTFNTNNFDITYSGDLSLGHTVAAATTTFNAGSSTISGAVYDGATYSTGDLDLNFGSSTWIVSDDWTYSANTTSNVGTASVTFTGTPTVTAAGADFPDLIFENNASLFGDSTITSLEISSGNTYTFDNTATYTVSGYTAGDWDGGIFVSDSPGSQWGLVAPSGITVFNMNVRDSDNSGGGQIDATDFSNIGFAQNNINWLFSPSAAGSSWWQASDYYHFKRRFYRRHG